MSLDYNYGNQDNISVGITSNIKLRIQVQQPVDNVLQICARHYQQAFSFYFQDDTKENLTREGRIISSILRRFKYKTDSLEYEEIWNDVILKETAKYFAKHEQRSFEKLVHYVLYSIKREIFRYKKRKNKYQSRFGTGFDDLINYCEIKQENHLSTGGYLRSPSIVGSQHGGKLSKLIFKFLEDKVSPIHLKVYELTYHKNMSDKEIAQVIRLPIHTIWNVRQVVYKILRENKFDLLTEAGLTEDDMTLK